jgi:hypothetical protein
LESAFCNNELDLKGGIAGLAESTTRGQLMVKLSKKSWNVYAKEPFNGGAGGVTYLSRYFAKTAIGNERILSCDDNQVAFKWRDYSDNSKTKIMTLDAHEFIRRYLSHILPDRFMRVRSFGFLSNACKTKNISTIRSLLQSNDEIDEVSTATDTVCNAVTKAKPKESVTELMKRIAGIDIEICKHCKTGRLEKRPLLPEINQTPESWDTS